MIFQGLFNILELYINDIELFYNNIDNHIQEKIKNSFGNSPIDKNSLNRILEDLCIFLKKYFVELGFENVEIENKFLDPFLEIGDNDKKNLSMTMDIYEIKIAPLVYEIFLTKIID
jgi:hypothetical protein